MPAESSAASRCLLGPNPKLSDDVWQAWDAVPTQTIPQRGAAPVKRLASLALALSSDGLLSGALAQAEREMHLVLDAARTRYPDLLKKAVNEIWSVRGQAISGRTGESKLTYQDFVERADDRAIQVGFSDAKKAFGGDVAHSYVNHLTAGDDDDDTLRDAYVTTSALAIVPEVRAQIDREADELAQRWFADYRVLVKGLSDDRQQEYANVQALATEPQEGTLIRPRTRIEDYVEDVDGQLAQAPMVDRHLMSDADGMCPIGALNVWEREVVVKELSRPTSVGWYRNPPRQSVDSLGIAYRDEVGNWRSMHPDFVFFNHIDGAVIPSIVDPHGHHLEDSLVKLQGLAKFAKEYGDRFHRIEAVTKLANSMRILDLKLPAVRDAVLASKKPPLELYESNVAIDYDSGPAR